MTRKKPGAVMGRPRKWKFTAVDEATYNRSHTETVVKLMAAGYFDYQIMAFLNITKRTWDSWMKEEEDFKNAVELGIPKRIHYWFTEGKEKLKSEGDKGIKTWTYVVNHMMPRDMPGWEADKPKSGNNTTINVAVINKDPKELLQDIKTSFSQLWEHQKVELLEQVPEVKNIIYDESKPASKYSAEYTTITDSPGSSGNFDPETEIPSG